MLRSLLLVRVLLLALHTAAVCISACTVHKCYGRVGCWYTVYTVVLSLTPVLLLTELLLNLSDCQFNIAVQVKLMLLNASCAE
jgi:hypothetical protein